MRLHLGLIVWLVMSSCTSSSGDGGIRYALVAGDQEAVDAFTRRFLNDDMAIGSSALSDDSLVSRSIVLRADEDDRLSQYGVDRVSEYFMCLLQIKFHTSSRDVLSGTLLNEECGLVDQCEPCNSLTYPLPSKVRNQLRTYWSERLSKRRH
jgi:hypothetical protein